VCGGDDWIYLKSFQSIVARKNHRCDGQVTTRFLTAQIALLVALTLMPRTVFAAEPAWWTQQKQQCGLPPSTAYNDWTAQGSPCPARQNLGAGGVGLTPQQQLGSTIGNLGAQMMLQGFQGLINGDPNQEARDRAAAAAAQAAAAEQAKEQAARLEETKQRLLGLSPGLGQSQDLGLMGMDSGSGSGLQLMTGEESSPDPSEAIAPACKALRGQIAELRAAKVRAALAAVVYSTFDGALQDPTAPPGMHLVSNSMTEMQKLFPGADAEKIGGLIGSDTSDYRAAFFQDDKTKELFVAFRGTQSGSAGASDWWSGNIPQALGKESDYYQRAKGVADLLKTSPEARQYGVEFVGHSLGGGMAAAAALEACAPVPGAPPQKHRWLCDATTFNAAGVNARTANGIDMPSANGYVKSYVVDGDPLTLAQDHPAAVIAGVGAVATAAPITTGLALARQGASPLDLAQGLPPSIGRRVTLPSWDGEASYGSLDRHGIDTAEKALDLQLGVALQQYQSGCSSPAPK
jgi:hypothetical protein